MELSPTTLNALAKLPAAERKKLYAELGQQEWDRCAKDPMYWLDPSRHVIPYVHTRDPKQLYTCRLCGPESATYFFDNRHTHLERRHSIETEEETEIAERFAELPTVRPFTIFPYVEPIVKTWLREKFLFIEKSRDMMATWLIVSLYTWDTLFHQNRENIFQSDDSTKTLDLVERAFFIWENQPAFLKSVHPAGFTAGQTRAGIMKVPSLKSIILGFPQGPDQIRQFHPSGVFQDEAAFQTEAQAAFMAVKPAVQAGGRFTAVSSANPGWFMASCRDIQI